MRADSQGKEKQSPCQGMASGSFTFKVRPPNEDANGTPKFLPTKCAGCLPVDRALENRALRPGIADGAGNPAPEPVPEPHFPDRLHLFVWRNWELANTDRMAQVLGTTPEKVLEVGASMGLPTKPHLNEDQLRRIYITVIRQNWHVLPDDQLMELLGWDRQHYEYTLKEDDFSG